MTFLRTSSTFVHLAVFLLLLGTMAAATTAPQLEVQSSTAKFQGSTAQAGFDALVLEAFQGRPQASPSFYLTAETARIETDRSVVTLLQTTDVAEEPESRTYHRPEISGVTNRPSHSFVAIAAPGQAHASIESHCSEVRISNSGSIAPTPFVNGQRELPKVETRESLLWEDCGSSSTLNIQGDFTLVLWEWDGLLVADGTKEVLSSGHKASEQAPDAYPYVGRATQQWIIVQDGTLSLPLGEQAGLYLRHMDIVARNVGFLGAHGLLRQGDQTTTIAANNLELHGAMDLRLQGSNNMVQSKITGHIEGMETDGTPVLLATPTTATPALGPGPLVLAALAVVLLGAIFIHARPTLLGAWNSRHRAPQFRPTGPERRAEGHQRLADRCGHNGRSRRAIKHLNKAIRLMPDNPGLLLNRALLHRRRGNYRAALEDHRDAHMWLRSDPSDPEATYNALEAARAAALAKEDDAAFWWLGVAVGVEPDLVMEVDGEPDFSRLRKDIRYHQIRGVRGGPQTSF